MSVGPVAELTAIRKTVTLANGDDLPILRGVNLAVYPGEVVAIRGRSGTGKSTLLNILGLLDPPTAGVQRCFGADTTALSDRARSQMRGAQIGFVFQAFHLLDRRSAIDNVAEPCLYAGWRSLRHRREAARACLERVGLADRAESMPHQLSGGEQQRVALARAIVRKPALILADEPTGSLDTETGTGIIDLLLSLAADTGTAVVLVTHDPAVASRADTVVTLTQGILESAA